MSIVLSALVAGIFHVPRLALARSIRTFAPAVFLPIMGRLNRTMAPVLTVLLPATLLSMIPVLLLSFRQPLAFSLNAAAFALFVVALLVTILVEVPLVEEIASWTVQTLPPNWHQLRDRWIRFHILRVAAGLGSLILLLAGAIF